jgi:hypothetical protein
VPKHRVLHNLGSDAALAHQQTLVDQLLDGLPRRQPGQRQALCQCQLVFETITGRQVPVPDSSLDCLRELRVERDKARPVELNRQWHIDSDLGLGPDESSCMDVHVVLRFAGRHCGLLPDTTRVTAGFDSTTLSAL